MKVIELKKNFKSKTGYYFTKMIDLGGKMITVEHYRVYPSANGNDRMVAKIDGCFEYTRDEANEIYRHLKKDGYEITIK